MLRNQLEFAPSPATVSGHLMQFGQNRQFIVLV